MRWACLCVLLVFGCDENKRPGGGLIDSESHWLETCADESTCGGLACVCGVCSRACDDACADFSDAVCRAVSTCGPGERICVPASVAPDQGVDLGLPPDAGRPLDAGVPLDAGLPVDAGMPVDAGLPVDAGVPVDAGMPVDGGLPVDGGGADAEPPDVGAPCPPENACCQDEDCPLEGAKCAPAGSGRQGEVCDPDAAPGNVCLNPECVVDPDCGRGQACIPAGSHGFVVATCAPAPCQPGGACDAEPGGECVDLFTPCFNGGNACWYPSAECRVDDDCVQRQAQQVCLPNGANGALVCVIVGE